MSFTFRLAFLLLWIKVSLSKTLQQQEHSSWTAWSSCSNTCGNGLQNRIRKCLHQYIPCANMTEKRFCFNHFCPSYLSWPRIHIFGKFVADVSTVNNIRCNYDNEHFSLASASRWFQNWGPDGSGHVYFVDARATSICIKPGYCSTTDFVTKRGFYEGRRGVIVDIDPDWMKSPEIWGLSIKIPDIMEATFSRASIRKLGKRLLNSKSDRTSSAVYKSKLKDIIWYSSYHKVLFNNATELSISFTLDQFNFEERSTRVTGTIGLTSEDDPRQTVASRAMRGRGKYKGVGIAPFFIHYDKKYLTIDLSNSLMTDNLGRFLSMEKADLAVVLSSKTYCKQFWKPPICTTKYASGGSVIYPITHNGFISNMIKSNDDWYKKFGGIVDINLAHIRDDAIQLMRKNPLALVQMNNGNSRTLLMEAKLGIHAGIMGPIIYRLNPGEKQNVAIFVSKFGKPAVGIHVDFDSFTKTLTLGEAVNCPFYCNKTLGWPKDALAITSRYRTPLTNSSGIVEYLLQAVRGPAGPRKCGLFGQLYPTHILVKYIAFSKTYIFEEGSNSRVKKPYIDIQSLPMMTQVFDEVENLQCPTWQHVKGIFETYYNLYPVMRKNDIIDLHSYEDVKSKVRALKASMFDFDVKDPRYMPFQRDMDYSKKRLIWNWIKCGMKKEDPIVTLDEEISTCSNFQAQLDDLKRDIENALFAEFATIPLYLTAWLSIKAEEGRNVEVAVILKSIVNEEMKHMTLAANLLNAIGGKVNFAKNHPTYPCSLSMGSFYGLDKGHVVSLGKMSLGRISDVFSAIERPVGDNGKKLLSEVVKLWRMIPVPFTSEKPPIIKYFQRDYHDNTESTLREDNSSVINDTSAWQNIEAIVSLGMKKIARGKPHTVGGFYTKIALKLAQLESCARLQSNSNSNLTRSYDTIFTGNRSWQLNASHWYKKMLFPQEAECAVADVSKTMLDYPQLQKSDVATHSRENAHAKRQTCENDNLISNEPFEITNLASALRAVVEIVYEGEGGSGCSPFEDLLDGDSTQLSHYYRFQEILHGKRLKRVRQNATLPSDVCVEISDWCKQFQKDWKFCYSGKPITFYEDGVWPIIENPGAISYIKNSRAAVLNRQFNLAYSRLLWCLNSIFNGNPSHVRNCMSDMYDLTVIGKSMVATSVEHKKDSNIQFVPTPLHATPSFKFIDGFVVV